jgi:hypothetical protein
MKSRVKGVTGVRPVLGNKKLFFEVVSGLFELDRRYDYLEGSGIHRIGLNPSN